MKLTHLRDVIAIVDRGSLRAAAKHLKVTQPGMSRSIRELEQELEVVLFERDKSGMKPTAAGEIFVRRARGVQADLQHGLDEIAQLKGSDVGAINVGFSSAGMLTMLPRIIAPFRKRFPKIRISLVETSLPVVETDLRDGLIDMYYGPVPAIFTDTSLVVERLFSNPRMIVGRKGHPKSKATTLAELQDEEWVSSHIDMDTDGEVIALFESAGLQTPKIAMQAGSAMSLISIVGCSDLLAPVSAHWSGFLQETEALARLAITDLPLASPICAVRRRAMPLTPAADYWNDLAARTAQG